MTQIKISAGRKVLVEDQDADYINQWRWTFTPHHSTEGRAYRRVSDQGKSWLVAMHREIWSRHNGSIPKGMVIDHINGNSLDNRLSNLRMCTQGENMANRNGPQKNGKSGHLGVALCKQTGMWKAYCSKNGKQYWAGRFAKLEDAVEARKELSIKIHGEYSPESR